MQAQNQPKQNKWLTIGITPPHIFNEHAANNQKRLDGWAAAKENKRDYVAFCKWAVKNYPEGFTYFDIILTKGKNTVYWGQYIFELKNLKLGLIKLLGSKATGNKNGRCSIYQVVPSMIKELEVELKFKPLNTLKGIHHEHA